jgi:hypothetical protein
MAASVTITIPSLHFIFTSQLFLVSCERAQIAPVRQPHSLPGTIQKDEAERTPRMYHDILAVII